MVSARSLSSFLAAALFSVAGVLNAQTSEPLFSPLVAETFHKTARETVSDSQEQLAVARVFLSAAAKLNTRADYLYSDVLAFGAATADPDEVEPMIRTFTRYAGRNSDFAILRKTVRYFLSTADSRKAREDLLMRLFMIARESNPMLASEIIAEYAGLMEETARIDDALKNYEQAWYYNKYNQRAFLRLDELLRKQDRGLNPVAYAANMRLDMDLHPLDLDRALAFAGYCDRLGVYDVAAGAYEYAADLFGYLNAGSPLPASIYLPWMLACYNTPNMQSRCLDIAARVRRTGRFDLRMEAIAGAAESAVGNNEVAQRTLDNAARKAAQMLDADAVAGDVTALHLAWFYAFADPSPEQALAWANRALAAEPDRPDAKALFAYALAMTDQYDLAATYSQQAGDAGQIALLSRAVVELSQNKTDAAVASLKQSIAIDPASLAAQKARAMLDDNGSEYIPPVSPHLVREQLKKEVGERIVPAFRPARDIFSAKLNFRGSEFSYGSDMSATLVITNESQRPLVISDESLLTGRIRVDADVKGDISQRIERLIDRQVVPGTPIAPGDYTSVPLDLMTGALRKLLLSFPQASLEIEFTVYLDPVIDPAGRLVNALTEVPPVRTLIKRQGVNLTRDYLMQRLDALARGQEGQKIRAAELFAGLLIENDHMVSAGPVYKYIRVERPILVDAVKRCLADDNWKVRIETMEALTLAAGLDYELTRVMSSNLNDQRWPVRMMAMYLLTKLQNDQFAQVLDWAAQHDAEGLVRQLAIELAAARNAK